ncbi:unnamed protein product [Rotaria magnacalcarata]|nr:unnamed protein product [Rotaria magnacalcarata]
MAPLRRELTRFFTKYPVDLSRRMNFEKEIQNLFHASFDQSIPSTLEERILYEKQLIKSIRYQLNKDQLILRRTVDNYNTYYLGSLNEFQKKSDDFVQHSISYEFIGMLDCINTEQQQLDEIIDSINSQFETLHQKRLINNDYRTKFIISKKSTTKLPHLYFLPETNEDIEMTVQPKFSSYQYSPIQKLAQYLDELLRPLFNNLSVSTRFLNTDDFIYKLRYFAIKLDSLLPKTQFVTFKIHDLYDNVTHAGLLQALYTFLAHPLVSTRHKRLSNDAIHELTAIVLRNNFFSYDDKIYRFTKGCPLNLQLTDLLGDIYLYDWQFPLVRQLRLNDLFYGRYHNIGLMTWYGPIEQLQTILDELEQLLPSGAQLTSFIATTVHFMDCLIDNR